MFHNQRPQNNNNFNPFPNNIQGRENNRHFNRFPNNNARAQNIGNFNFHANCQQQNIFNRNARAQAQHQPNLNLEQLLKLRLQSCSKQFFDSKDHISTVYTYLITECKKTQKGQQVLALLYKILLDENRPQGHLKQILETTLTKCYENAIDSSIKDDSLAKAIEYLSQECEYDNLRRIESNTANNNAKCVIVEKELKGGVFNSPLLVNINGQKKVFKPITREEEPCLPPVATKELGINPYNQNVSGRNIAAFLIDQALGGYRNNFGQIVGTEIAKIQYRDKNNNIVVQQGVLMDLAPGTHIDASDTRWESFRNYCKAKRVHPHKAAVYQNELNTYFNNNYNEHYSRAKGLMEPTIQAVNAQLIQAQKNSTGSNDAAVKFLKRQLTLLSKRTETLARRSFNHDLRIAFNKMTNWGVDIKLKFNNGSGNSKTPQFVIENHKYIKDLPSQRHTERLNIKDPNLYRGLLGLSIIDCIIGQKDRHNQNFLYDSTTGRVTGIDNECAFPLEYKKIKDNRNALNINKLRKLTGDDNNGSYAVTLPSFMDNKMYQGIMNINIPALTNQLKNCLTKKELENVLKNIQEVKEHAKKLRQENKIFSDIIWHQPNIVDKLVSFDFDPNNNYYNKFRVKHARFVHACDKTDKNDDTSEPAYLKPLTQTILPADLKKSKNQPRPLKEMNNRNVVRHHNNQKLDFSQSNKRKNKSQQNKVSNVKHNQFKLKNAHNKQQQKPLHKKPLGFWQSLKNQLISVVHFLARFFGFSPKPTHN